MRKSPCTPLRVKAKGKEIRRDYANRDRLSPAPARTRGPSAKQLVANAVNKALFHFGGTRGPSPSDEALWATICWRVGPEKFENAIREKLSENRHDGEPHDLVKSFQAFLNKKFPKEA